MNYNRTFKRLGEERQSAFVPEFVKKEQLKIQEEKEKQEKMRFDRFLAMEITREDLARTISEDSGTTV
ncbi:MAG: hypothetical protein VXV87_05855, partial [Pseudomonadota bacterium]|nr:hypothetical protein [Pseudomonadota bacterium]